MVPLQPLSLGARHQQDCPTRYPQGMICNSQDGYNRLILIRNSILMTHRQLMGRKAYPQAPNLLICADAGGSNGSRLRAWKIYLQALADRLGIAITVCHYPPGTSKWNKVEHRLFSFISMNWRGRPLLSYETVVNLIGATTTKSGLWVKALLDTRDTNPVRRSQTTR